MMTQLPAHLLLGLSGGADSVALFRLLLEKDTRITAVHVNHGLRGAESDADEQFVRDLCQAHHVPLMVFRAELPPHASEDQCRRARYAFFRRAMAASGADALALAHHRDDQAEAFLLHLLRGAGPSGLSGMQPDTFRDGIRILRPLLDFSREELRDMLTGWGQPWREDSSNEDTGYLRNALRHRLIPLMEELSPGAAGRIAASADMIRAEHDDVIAQATAFLQQNAGMGWIRVTPLLALPYSIRCEALRSWWHRHQDPEADERTLSREQTAALCRLPEGRPGDSCPLPERRTARLGRHCLTLDPFDIPQDMNVLSPADGAAVAGISLHLSGAPAPGCERLPAALLRECELRTCRPGDVIIPFGKHTPVPLKDYLAKRHVEALFRTQLPLLCRGSEVLLTAGAGTGNIPREQTDPVYLTWNGMMPWID